MWPAPLASRTDLRNSCVLLCVVCYVRSSVISLHLICGALPLGMKRLTVPSCQELSVVWWGMICAAPVRIVTACRLAMCTRSFVYQPGTRMWSFGYRPVGAQSTCKDPCAGDREISGKVSHVHMQYVQTSIPSRTAACTCVHGRSAVAIAA